MARAPKDKACLDNINLPSLQDIFEKSHDSICVTDAAGNMLMANPSAARVLALPREQLLGANVKDLVERGYYDKSIALQAAVEKKTVTGIIRTKAGLALMSTSVPFLNDNGDVSFVISNIRDTGSVDQLLRTLEQERGALDRYRNEVAYHRNQTIEKNQLVYRSALMREVVTKADAVARVSAPVLLLGESGVGKDVVARYIHRQSDRAREPFIVVNCAAIPENLIESELFGYEKGAFSGASPQGKPGLMAMADKGTLFLDEIPEIPLPLQAKLLRVLETYEIRRVGGTVSRKIDFRLIAATNRHLKTLVEQGKYREDLFYRLTGFPIKIPPLRARPDDIEPLLEAFLQEFNKKYGCAKRLSPAAIASALSYHWPGNVRELRNVLERLIISTPGDVLECSRARGAMPLSPAAAWQAAGVAVAPAGSLREVLQKVEEAYIRQVLRECDGQVGKTAQKLGIHRSALWRKIQEYKDIQLPR